MKQQQLQSTKTITQRAEEWWKNPLSAKTNAARVLWLHMMNRFEVNRGWICGDGCIQTPYCLAECLEILQLIPEWQSRLPELVRYNKQWAVFCVNWQHLAKLFTEETGTNWDKCANKPADSLESLKLAPRTADAIEVMFCSNKDWKQQYDLYLHCNH